MKKYIALGVFLVLSICCVVHALYFYPKLPAQVPSNFNAAGEAHGWTPKGHLLTVYLGVVAGTAFFFPGLGLLMSWRCTGLVNIPNKQYWLAPERRAATMNYILCTITWLGSATLLFVMYLFHGCYQAALVGANAKLSMTGPLIAGALYGGSMIVAAVLQLVRFRKVG